MSCLAALLDRQLNGAHAMFQNAAQRVHEDLSNLSEYNHGLMFEMKRMQWLSREALAKEVRSRVHAPPPCWLWWPDKLCNTGSWARGGLEHENR